MGSKRVWIGGVSLYLLGAVAGWAASKVKIDASAYSGKAPAAAAAALLQTAQTLAEDGSFENIAVGRVHYLSGHQAEGQALFDRYLGAKAKSGDYMRVARIYLEAKQWDKAKPILDKVVALDPKDEDFLAEVGVYYNLHGDRAHAEELFAQSLAQDPANLYNSLKMAGSYLGVPPG
ncbi:MAG TPA: hypothetical protein VGV61_17465 [Thermoanaerobaculia bacterium]|jgi:tetratricopeptide (TPR) repeat protein|nr:hypothetical protein [Thermoanaerobaculia bacterium]